MKKISNKMLKRAEKTIKYILHFSGIVLVVFAFFKGSTWLRFALFGYLLCTIKIKDEK